MQNLLSKNFSINTTTLLLSVYFACVFNFTFLQKTYNDLAQLEQFNLAYFISLPLFLTSIFIIFFSLLPQKYIYKTTLFLFVLLSAVFCYAISSYGIIIDYGMIENMAETSTAEAFTYINPSAILYVLLLITFPLAVLYKTSPKVQTFKASIHKRVKLILSAVTVILIIFFTLYSSYASVNRNNRDLSKYIVPIPSLISGYKYIKQNYFYEPTVFKVLDSSPKLLAYSNPSNSSLAATNEDKNVIVMIVGETARAKSFSLNGYNKNTNEYTEKLNLVSFKQMHSCGTATAVSVPCMFSLLKKDQFNKQLASSQQNLLDIAKLADIDVLWIDNNEGCKGVCERVNTINIDKNKSNPLCDGDYCFDEILLNKLDDKLNNLSHQTTLIVLHLMGSHGPTYYRRYPKEFATFLPDCQQSDIQNCTSEQLVNTYDNTIHYSDYVIAEVVKRLDTFSQANTKSQSKSESSSDIRTDNSTQSINAEMLYVSDHGESLGEHGLYLHGFPYSIAPDEQTHVPMLFWSNNKTKVLNNNCVKASSQEAFTHDNIFHSMLGLLNIDTSTYQGNMDIFNACYIDSNGLRVANLKG